MARTRYWSQRKLGTVAPVAGLFSVFKFADCDLYSSELSEGKRTIRYCIKEARSEG